MLFRSVLRVSTVAELFAAAGTLARVRPLRGARTFIMTNGGGAGVLAADAAAACQVELPALGDATLEELDRVLPAGWSRGNPVDIIGDAPAGRYVETLAALGRDGGADAILFAHAPTAIVSSEEIARVCAPIARASSVPVFGCWLGGEGLKIGRAHV